MTDWEVKAGIYVHCVYKYTTKMRWGGIYPPLSRPPTLQDASIFQFTPILKSFLCLKIDKMETKKGNEFTAKKV